MNLSHLLKNGKWVRNAKNILSNPILMRNLINQAIRLSKKNGLKELKDTFNLMTSYLKDIFNGSYKGYSGGQLLLITTTILYVVSPLDLIPDMLLFIGWTDDISLLTYAVIKANDELQRYKSWKQTDTPNFDFNTLPEIHKP